MAIVRPADLKYYTKVRDFCDVHVTGGRAYYPAAVRGCCQAAIPEALSTLLAMLSRACWTLHCFSPRCMPRLQTVTCWPLQQLDCRVSWPGLLWRLPQTWAAVDVADPAASLMQLS